MSAQTVYLDPSIIKNPLTDESVSIPIGEQWNATTASMTLTDGTITSNALTVNFLYNSQFAFMYAKSGGFYFSGTTGLLYSTSPLPAACVPSQDRACIYISGSPLFGMIVVRSSIAETGHTLDLVSPSSISGAHYIYLMEGILYPL
jgi:hypothetical protein